MNDIFDIFVADRAEGQAIAGMNRGNGLMFKASGVLCLHGI
jgi:hypothetical protein